MLLNEITSRLVNQEVLEISILTNKQLRFITNLHKFTAKTEIQYEKNATTKNNTLIDDSQWFLFHIECHYPVAYQ